MGLVGIRLGHVVERALERIFSLERLLFLPFRRVIIGKVCVRAPPFLALLSERDITCVRGRGRCHSAADVLPYDLPVESAGGLRSVSRHWAALMRCWRDLSV